MASRQSVVCAGGGRSGLRTTDAATRIPSSKASASPFALDEMTTTPGTTRSWRWSNSARTRVPASIVGPRRLVGFSSWSVAKQNRFTVENGGTFEGIVLLLEKRVETSKQKAVRRTNRDTAHCPLLLNGSKLLHNQKNNQFLWILLGTTFLLLRQGYKQKNRLL